MTDGDRNEDTLASRHAAREIAAMTNTDDAAWVKLCNFIIACDDENELERYNREDGVTIARALKDRLAGEDRDDCEFCLGAKGGRPGNENAVNGRLACDYCHALMMPAPSPTTPPQAREELTPEIAEIEKRHAEGRAEANGYGDYTFSEWCIRNGKGAHNDRATLLAHIKARAPNDYFAFFQKHALGSLAAPSCLACGRAEPFSIRHGELPNIGLCDACTARTRAGESK